jgi:hypothetical protein
MMPNARCDLRTQEQQQKTGEGDGEKQQAATCRAVSRARISWMLMLWTHSKLEHSFDQLTPT